MSNPTSNFNWQMPTATDLVTDLPADFEVFGQAVDSSLADLKGGTSGQILAKNTNADMDFVWVTNDVGDITAVTAGTGISGGGTSGAVTITNSMATEITASGDIIVGTGSGTFDNLPIGTTGQILTADTTVSPYKVKWATPATPASGYTKIAAASFSGVSSVEVDSIFNSTYDNYKIVLRVIGSVNGENLGLQYRYSGTTQASDYYGSAVRWNRSGTQTSFGTTNGSSYEILTNLQTSTLYYDYLEFTVTNVGQSSTQPVLFGTANQNSGTEASIYAMCNVVSRTYTGIRFVPYSGTISGNYYIYGLAN